MSGRRQRLACSALVLVAAAALSACDARAAEETAPPATASHALFIDTLPFPPLRTTLSGASPELQRLVESFAAFLAAAELPEVDKQDFREISADAILERKQRWVDVQVVQRFQRLAEATTELQALASAVPAADLTERVAAQALAGAAQRMVANDWSSLNSGSGLFLLGPKASLPADFTAEDADAVAAKELEKQAEVEAYFDEQKRGVRAPDAQAGLAQLKACVEGAGDAAEGVLAEWRALCEEWMR